MLLALVAFALVGIASDITAAAEPPLSRAAVENMSAQQVIDRVLGRVGEIFVEIRIGFCRNCPLSSIAFYTKPEMASSGVCSVVQMLVAFEPIDAVRPATRDSAVKVSKVLTNNLFRLVDREHTKEDCERLKSSDKFFRADSAGAVRRAARLLNQAVQEATGADPLSFDLMCEGMGCENPRSQLARAKVDDISFVETVVCATPEDPGRVCFNVAVKDATILSTDILNVGTLWLFHLSAGFDLAHELRTLSFSRSPLPLP